MKPVALTAMTMVLTMVLAAQSPIPLGGGGSGRQGAPGQRGAGAIAPALPTIPTTVEVPTITGPIAGPGPMFESLMALPASDDMAHFKYEATEYFVSGTTSGQPYTTRDSRRNAKCRIQNADPE